MKQALQILCAVIISISALIGLSCVASADSFDTMPVTVTQYPAGTIVEFSEGFRDTSTRRTAEEIVRASMMQDFVPILEETLASGKFNTEISTSNSYENFNVDFDTTISGAHGTRAALAHLKASNWGEIYKIISIDQDTDKFYQCLLGIATISSGVKDTVEQIYINFKDDGRVYSLLVRNDDKKMDIQNELRKAFLTSVTAFTFCIYECEGTPTLAPISSIDMNKYHLAYIVHPFVGIIPCNIQDNEIANFDDYLDKFYLVGDFRNKGAYWLPDWTQDGTIGYDLGTFFEVAMDNNWSGSSKSELVRETYNNWNTELYTCYFQGTISYTVSGETKQGIYLHPEYVVFVTQLLSADPEYTIGLTSIEDKSGLAVSFIARKNAAQAPTCLLNTLHPLGYVDEWAYTDVSGIYKSSFSDSGKPVSSRLGKAIFCGGLRYSGTAPEEAKYRYEFIRSATIMSTIRLENYIDTESNLRAGGSFYYYDISTGKVYKNNKAAPKQVFGETLASYHAYTLISPLASRLISKFEATDITLDRTSLYCTSVTMIPPTVDATRKVITINSEKELTRNNDNILRLYSDFVSLLIVPDTYMECVDVTSSETATDASSGATTTIKSTYMVGTGREVEFDLSKAETMNLLDTNGAVKYKTSGEQASGVYYNSNGRLYSSEKANIKMDVYMLDDGPAIVLSEDYLEQSNVLAWLETSQASEYISGNASTTGYTANMLYQRLINKGITLGGEVGKEDKDRIDDIRNELEVHKQGDIVGLVFTILAFLGIILMVYACLLVICFYIDIFNTITNFSLLNIITFGGYKAIAKKSDLDVLGITDPKERKRYLDRFSIIGRWALVMGLGLLLFGSNQVFVWASMAYNWLTSLFGI